MPCFDAQSAQENRENHEKVPFLEAALCAALKALHKSFMEELRNDTSGDPDYRDHFDLIDFKEAGITREQLERWRNEHDARDRGQR